MKINLKGKVEAKEIYQVGNVIKDEYSELYLVVNNVIGGYQLIDLNDNQASIIYETLEELINSNNDRSDVLIDAEINEI